MMQEAAAAFRWRNWNRCALRHGLYPVLEQHRSQPQPMASCSRRGLAWAMVRAFAGAKQWAQFSSRGIGTVVGDRARERELSGLVKRDLRGWSGRIACAEIWACWSQPAPGFRSAACPRPALLTRGPCVILPADSPCWCFRSTGCFFRGITGQTTASAAARSPLGVVAPRGSHLDSAPAGPCHSAPVPSWQGRTCSIGAVFLGRSYRAVGLTRCPTGCQRP